MIALTARLILLALVPLTVGAGSAGAVAAVSPRPEVQPDVPVTAVDLRQGRERAHNSPALAVDPTDSRFVVLASRVDVPQFGCRLEVSGDGGRGWIGAHPVPALPSGAERCYAPEVDFGRDGTLYYLFVGLHTAGNSPMGVFLTTSTDRARTFSAPRQVLGPERYQVQLAIDRDHGDRGRIHVVWLEARSAPPLGGLAPPPNPIMAAYSDDGGASFSKPVQVSDPDRLRVVAPALAVGADHAVHVLYYDLMGDSRDYQGLEGPVATEPWSLVSTRSTDGGQTFDRGVLVDPGVVAPERVMLVFTMPPPAVAVDGSRVYASWYDARNGDWDVFLRRSSDGGRTWDAVLRLNDDPSGDGRHQYLPRLAVAPGGRVDAIFYDRREDPQNVRNDVMYTYSLDSGATFSSNVKLSAESSDTTIGPRYAVPAAAGLVDVGSRLALVSEPQRALAAWTDTRNARPGEEQDVFAASILLSPFQSPPGTP